MRAVGASVAFIFTTFFVQSYCTDLFIDNFQKSTDLSEWVEHSDTVMLEGKSKSSFVLHDAGTFRRAVLFTLLNPQSCGAALAGIRKNVTLDTRKFKSISLRIRGQGQYRGYEFFMKQRGVIGDEYPSYVHYFEAPTEFEVVNLPIRNFKAHLRGEVLESAKPLNKSLVTSLGIVAYGGAHLPRKQYGVAALEIDWIKLE